jgi:hypothetical protein
MKLSRIWGPAALVLPLVLVTVRPAAADDVLSRQTLRGISGISVVVENLKEQARQGGLHEEDIRTDVELKLRLAGVKVLTAPESTALPGSPYLYVSVTSVLSGAGVYGLYVEVSLNQRVLLAREQSISVTAPTWSTSYIVTIGMNNLLEVRDDIKELVDKFLNAYLSVNPKK